ncbi:MAG: hypothetical protein WBW61_10220, partial [Rhodanobacteraceae bacterium]
MRRRQRHWLLAGTAISIALALYSIVIRWHHAAPAERDSSVASSETLGIAAHTRPEPRRQHARPTRPLTGDAIESDPDRSARAWLARADRVIARQR